MSSFDADDEMSMEENDTKEHFDALAEMMNDRSTFETIDEEKTITKIEEKLDLPEYDRIDVISIVSIPMERKKEIESRLETEFRAKKREEKIDSMYLDSFQAYFFQIDVEGDKKESESDEHEVDVEGNKKKQELVDDLTEIKGD